MNNNYYFVCPYIVKYVYVRGGVSCPSGKKIYIRMTVSLLSLWIRNMVYIKESGHVHMQLWAQQATHITYFSIFIFWEPFNSRKYGTTMSLHDLVNCRSQGNTVLFRKQFSSYHSSLRLKR